MVTHSFGFLDAVKYLFEHCLHDFEFRAQLEVPTGKSAPPVQRVGRSVAATFSSLVRFIRRLVCTPITVSPLASILSRLKWDQIPSVCGDEHMKSALLQSVASDEFFEPEHFAAGMHMLISDMIYNVWIDKRLQGAPPCIFRVFAPSRQ